MENLDNIVEIQHVDFGYKSNEAVLTNLSMSIPQNSIFGLLGNNGAGKTTLLRCLVGLCTPQKGRIFIMRSTIDKKRQETLSKIGALIETPSFYDHLSGIENLQIAGTYLNVDHQAIEKVIELTLMHQFAKKKCKTYSTGMKQRLGIALALLRSPDILILDEPTNGLDPNGIVDLRNLLKSLKAEGKTIIISSHLLGEIAKTATHLGIIKNGYCSFNDTIEAFTTSTIDFETQYLQNNKND